MNTSWQVLPTVKQRAKARLALAAEDKLGILGASAIVRILTGAAPSEYLWRRTLDALNGDIILRTVFNKESAKDYIRYFQVCTLFACFLAECDEATAQEVLAEIYGKELL